MVNGAYFVEISYGPSEGHFTFAHKPHKLKGLRLKLQTLGYRVVLVPVELINLCSIAMAGYEVFRCNMRYLVFNMEEDLDPVSKHAVAAVLNATKKILRAQTYFWIKSLLEQEMFTHSEYAPKEYWPKEICIKPMSSPCIDCCGLSIRKSEEKI